MQISISCTKRHSTSVTPWCCMFLKLQSLRIHFKHFPSDFTGISKSEGWKKAKPVMIWGRGGGAIESEVHVFKERASQLNTKKDTIQPENTKSEKSTENAPKL